jgi:uracil-DNA glycosylase family 4
VSGARNPAEAGRQAAASRTVAEFDAHLIECRACPRLVEWREQVAREKRASYRDQDYWGAPVPSFGSADPDILIVGLAPGAHGANRTGRMFTGDRSGDWLFGSLHRVGLAASATSTSRGDSQHLARVRINAAVHCAPPDNKPTPTEGATCAAWLDQELSLLAPAAIIPLGGIAWRATLASLTRIGWPVPRPRPAFAHAATVLLAGPAGQTLIIGSYHPSQQNTFTGRLTEPMLDAVFLGAREHADACRG